MRAVLIFTLLLSPAFAAPLEQPGDSWWSRVQILADDNMEGRLTGSDGFKRAAEYVASQYEQLGLKPAGTVGYFQPVTFESRQVNEEKSSLKVVREGRTMDVPLGVDAAMNASAHAARRLDAPAVFVGYGLVIPEYGINDLAGLDLKGKIAVYMRGAPSNLPPTVLAHFSSRKQHWRNLRESGAIGTIMIPTTNAVDIPWPRIMQNRKQVQMSLRGREFDESPGRKFSGQINPARSDELLFSGSGHSFQELADLANAKQRLPSFPLPVRIQSHLSMSKETARCRNVIGLLEGNDPILKKEYVVVSAHLDHVGVGKDLPGDQIYNGALDNASGVATWLEAAAALRRSATPLKRSVIFLMVTGEEKGLRGSHYFAARPTVPRKQIVANLNVDMFLPFFPLKRVQVLGINESTLGDDVRNLCTSLGLVPHDDLQPERVGFIRSDQYSFVRFGIPAVKCNFGFDLNSPEDRLVKAWLKDRYHAPGDDLTQPVDKAAAAQFNDLMLAILKQTANAPARPTWKETSFFRRYVTQPD